MHLAMMLELAAVTPLGGTPPAGCLDGRAGHLQGAPALLPDAQIALKPSRTLLSMADPKTFRWRTHGL